MVQKKQAAAKKVEPTLITITIEDHTAILQTGMIGIKRGNRGVIDRKQFSNTEQLVGALKEALAAFNGEVAQEAAAKPKAGKAKKPEPKVGDIKKAPAPAKLKPSRSRSDDEPIPTKQVSLF